MDLEGKVSTLATNRFTAAKEALRANLTPDAQEGETLKIEEALAQFEELETALYHGMLSGKGVRSEDTLFFGENIYQGPTSDKCLEILDSPEFRSVRKLAKICRELVNRLETATPPTTPEMQKFQERISAALETRAYKSDTASPFARFLQALSYQINTQAQGMGVFEEIGSEALKIARGQGELDDNTEVSARELSTWIDTATSKLEAPNWNTAFGWVLWALHNIEKAFLSFLDGQIPGAHKLYNSNRLGNFHAWIGDFSVGGKKIRFNLGPSLGTQPDATMKATLEWEKAHGRTHLQHTLECVEAKGEAARLEVMRDLAEDPTLTLIGTPLDGDITRGKGKFGKITSVKDFHSKLAEEVLDGEQTRSKIPSSVNDYNGFATGSLTQEEVKETIAASEAAFGCLLDQDAFSDPENNERLCRAMTLGFTGFLVLKTLMKLGPDAHPDEVTNQVMHTMGQACKQDVDRGPVVNAITIAFIQMAKNGKLTELDAKQIMGIVLGRALLVDNRLMIKSRLEGLLDLLHLIGQDEEGFTDKLKKFTEGASLSFTPSNAPSKA